MSRPESPLHLGYLQEHSVLKDAGFVRARMRTRCKATHYWPDLLRLIVQRNPSARKSLKGFGPERVV
ncbi:MAG TPA: hypothetical protein VFE84_11525 [Patescibacteria group bacterium]|nr:hypothetical protein [Patescibacteria group bacterium]